jgi:hypothetical protein
MDGATPARLKNVTIAVFVAAFIMLLLGSKALLGWANDLPIGWLSDFVLLIAQTWQDWMHKIGLTGFADAAFNELRWAQALRW